MESDFQGCESRYDLGYGSIQLKWIKSHLKADVAIAQGQFPGKWLANAISDIHVDNAAAHFQLPNAQLQEVKVQAEQSVQMLKLLVAIAVKLAPAARAASRIVSGASQTN